MKVTGNTPDQIILNDVPWLLSLALVGMVLSFVSAGLHMMWNGEFWEGLALAVLGGGFSFGFLVGFAQRTQVIFDRGAGTVTRQNRWFFGYSKEVWPLGDVERAIVETHKDSDGDTHRPALLMHDRANRHVPLVFVYASGQGADRAVIAINAWLGTLDSRHEAP